MDDYTVKEFEDREPRYQVTAQVRPIAEDGSDHTELTKVLIKTGAIAKVRGVEFQIINDEIRVVFMSKSNPSRFNVEPRLADYQAQLSSTISRALELEPFFLALELMKYQGKRR